MPHLPLSSRVPVRSPCRRNLWSRNCPGVAGGWDPASSRPSSLSSYLLLAFHLPSGSIAPLPLEESPTLPRVSSRSFHPLSRADPLAFVFDTSSSLLYGRGILKRVGPCAHNPPGLQPERIGPWETDHPNSTPRFLHLAFRARGSERLLLTARCENIPVKRVGKRAWSLSQRQPQISKAFSLPLRKRDDRASARQEGVWFSFWRLSRLLVVEEFPGWLMKIAL